MIKSPRTLCSEQCGAAKSHYVPLGAELGAADAGAGAAAGVAVGADTGAVTGVGVGLLTGAARPALYSSLLIFFTCEL